MLVCYCKLQCQIFSFPNLAEAYTVGPSRCQKCQNLSIFNLSRDCLLFSVNISRMVQLRSNVNSSKYNLRKRKNNLTYSADERRNAVPALCTSSRLRNPISITRCTNTVFPDEKIKNCAAWNDLSDSTLNYSNVFVRLYFGNTASCIDGISVKDFADIYSNQFHSGEDVKWKGRQEYRRVRSNERDSIINESFSMIKTSQCLSFGVLQDIMASIDSNISCLSLMVKNNDNIFVVVTTCFFSIQTTNSGCSSYCNLVSKYFILCLMIIYTN